MPRIHIEGVPPYDGEHELDIGHLTNRDLHTIKQISGILPGDIDAAGLKGDNDLIVALAVIALRRKGLVVDEDVIWDAEIGRILFEPDEADAVPPPQTTGGESGKPSVLTGSSGASGRSVGDSLQVSGLSGTGVQASASVE